MDPVVLADASRIDQVGLVIFRVGENEIRVCHAVISSAGAGLVGQRNSRGPLHGLDGSFRSREANSMFIEIV